MQLTYDYSNHEAVLSAAETAIQHAQSVRSYHRKETHPRHPQRLTDIKHAENRIKNAMRPIRSALGRAPYMNSSQITEKRLEQLRDMSKLLQAERRKLWKLAGVRKRSRGR
jgi:hypothetical protein